MATPQTTATVPAHLEWHGLVERAPSEPHQKVVVNRATRAKRAVLKKADRAAMRVEHALSAEFTDEELGDFKTYLDRVIAALDDMR